MSVKQVTLNTSGFFSITSLQHKRHDHSGISWPGLWAPNLPGAQGKGFVHQKLHHEAPARSGSSPAASHERHCAPRRAEQFKGGTSLKVKLGKGVLSPGIQEAQERTVPVEGRQEATGGQQHGAHGEATALLIDPFEVAFGDVGHANSPGRAVEELVAIPRENTGSPSEL